MTLLTRSWMFVPGNRERYLRKAATSDVDCVFLDLEDGVLPEEKEAARELVAETLSRRPFGPRRFVRVNGIDTEWHDDDLGAVLRPGLAGLCVPKVERPDDIELVAARLDEAERVHSMPAGTLQIVAAIESAAAVVRAPEIASSGPRLLGLMFGSEDFALDLGLGTMREGDAAQLLYARSAVVVAAAAARVLSIDGVFPNLDDPDGMIADILQARRLGFSAKSTFNPRQVPEINRIFSPQPDEIDYARRVVDAYDAARARGDASVAVGGQLVDLPIVRRAQSVLAFVDGPS